MLDPWERVPIEPQSINAPLSRAAVFLVLTIDAKVEAVARVRSIIAEIGGLVRAVGFRDLRGRLSCNVGIGSSAWDRLGHLRDPLNFEVLRKSGGRCIPRWPHRETYCSTYERNGPTCASSLNGSFLTRLAML